nr:Flp family type IVb pilin [Stratiformator vulcanicus]
MRASATVAAAAGLNDGISDSERNPFWCRVSEVMVEWFGRAAATHPFRSRLIAELTSLERVAMKDFGLSVKKFLVSEDGPTAVEYAVMLALIVIVCLTAIQAIGTNANAKFEEVGNAIS